VPPTVILASASPYRLAQLRQIGVDAQSVPAGIEESHWKSRGLPIRRLARELARAKAESVFLRHPDAMVIGADQIASLDGEPFDKPGGFEKARRQLSRLSGRTHLLSTAVTVVHPEGRLEHVESIRMSMRPLTDEEIDSYLRADEPYDCVGCYRWESKGPLLFSAVRTPDPTAIIGLPLIWLSFALRSLGMRLP
jgi:septum formation protein